MSSVTYETVVHVGGVFQATKIEASMHEVTYTLCDHIQGRRNDKRAANVCVCGGGGGGGVGWGWRIVWDRESL